MGASLRFAKYEGLGNDFIVVDGRTQDLALAAEHAVALCDRHRGIGADGVLMVEFRGGLPAMRVINADGSRPEMCGNGLRCVVLYLAHSGFIAAPAHAREVVEVTVDTDSGPHRCRLWCEGGEDLVEVGMRAASLEPASLPVQAEGAATGPLLDAAFEVDGSRVKLSCVSMGNPHAVTFDDIGGARAALGPRLGTHPRFGAGANIGFARMVGPQSIELAVWERGAGFTEACGTGACAAAVAAIETGRAKRNEPIEVRLPGGPLRILVTERDKPILMTGPARRVFEGSVEL
jgi:diaminopimelate epimerase